MRTLHSMLGGALLAASLAVAAAIVEGQTANDRRYVVGGIGQGEVEQLKQIADKYSLQMIVSSRAGAYLADMHVRIMGANSQKILDTQLNAPWLLVDLMPGNYTVFVTHQGGKAQERKITIASGKRTELAVQFDVPADTAKSPAK
ncbi:MAG TPA: hypothetical protein VES91_07640 [Burkholderiaceae bacterium]|nr:hypothetical protein [Burkholderiaceae bacterium]